MTTFWKPSLKFGHTWRTRAKRLSQETGKLRTLSFRNLEIIGEAAGSIPDQIKKSAPEIDWRKITGLRNILIHEYFGINLPIIWDVVHTKLGPLETVCRRLLEGAAEPDQDIH